MEKESEKALKEIITSATGKILRQKDEESMSGPMEIIMKANDMNMQDLVSVMKNLQTKMKSILEILKTINLMGLEIINTLMGVVIKECGKMECKMDLEY